MPIEFKKEIVEARILTPRDNFQPETHITEHRWDPLTGWKRIFSLGLTEKGGWVFPSADEELIRKLVEESRKDCFFCPQNIERMTPRFPPDLLPEGRLWVGEACVLPNLYSINEFCAITVLSSKHYIRLDEFSHRVFIDALNASLEFVKRVHQVRPECKYAVMGVNYLPPASSSVVHPHLQLYLSHIPFHYLDRVLRLSEEYRKKNSGNYWDELVAVERQKGERYVGRARNTEWLASFAPMGFNEVQGIICNKSNFLEFDEADIEGISQGLSNVLRCYGEKMKLASFNVALVSGPLGEERDDFCANLRVISRPNLRSNYVSDGWFGEKLLLEGWSPFFPEDIAALLKGYFGP